MLKKSRILQSFAAIALLGLALTGCNRKAEAPPVPESRLFATPEAAVDAMVAALEKQDKDALSRILGPDGVEILSSGDPVSDAGDRDEFLAAYKAKHALKADGERKTLVIGTDDWPFPIPVAKQGDKWYLDTAAGADELIYRRIGENELGAIAVSRGYVDAQKEYASLGRDGGEPGVYAMKILSDASRQNGLYWPTSEGEDPSPIGAFVAEAAAEGYRTETASAYHGYRYRLLYRQAVETARCLAENVLTSVHDANIGSIFGIGMAPWTGGVLQYINYIGLPEFVKRADALAAAHGDRFTPPQLLRDMAAAGKTFE